MRLQDGAGGDPPVSAPVWMATADLVDGAVRIEGVVGPWSGPPQRPRVLLRHDRRPLTWTDKPPDTITVADFDRGDAGDPQPVPDPDGPEVTVVICTRDRPEQLRRCLQRLLAVVPPATSVIVVDNAPRNELTRRVVESLQPQSPALHYLREVRPGLSIARNTGLRHAATPIVAFTDDDVVVDRYWLDGVKAGFSRSAQTAVVTGMIPPAELRTSAQMGFDLLHERWTYDVTPETFEMGRRDQYSFLFPYSGGHIGAGANMSVKREVILSLGGFDEALGAGRRTGAGEDVEIFIRAARRGWQIAYEPAAITWHFHRETDSALRRQLVEHSIATGAFLTRVALEPGRRDLVRSAGRYAYDLARLTPPARTPPVPAPPALTPPALTPPSPTKSASSKGLVVAGLAAGPVLYAFERLRLRRDRRRLDAAGLSPSRAPGTAG